MNNALLKDNLAARAVDSQTRKVLSFHFSLIICIYFFPSFLRMLFQVEWMQRKQRMKVL